MFIVPMMAARDRRPLRGLRRSAFIILAFNVFYWYAIRYIYPRLGG